MIESLEKTSLFVVVMFFFNIYLQVNNKYTDTAPC